MPPRSCVTPARTSDTLSVDFPASRGPAPLSGAVIAEDCELTEDTVIGEDPERDAKRFHVTAGGVVLLTADAIGQTPPIG
jgi:glucose-1-phosphate adenylyltransferase